MPAPRLLINPYKIWFVINALTLTLLIFSALSLLRISSKENEKLAARELEMLTRSRIQDLAKQDYRAFVENIGQQFAELYVEISDGTNQFTFGEKVWLQSCSNRKVPLVSNLRLLSVTLCRPFSYPAATLLFLAMIYSILSVFFLVYIRVQERKTVKSLCDFIRATGVEIGENESLLGILNRLKEMKHELEHAKRIELHHARMETFITLARQVAHDVRSPLCVFSLVIDDESEVTREKRTMLKNAATRVLDITNNLISNNRLQSEAPTVSDEDYSNELLSVSIERIMSEKRAQYRGRLNLSLENHLDENSYGLFCRIQKGHFRRILSNLIDNSVESIESAGKVRVALKSDEKSSFVTINDTGKGISSEILPRLFKNGATFGKPKGNGLGLFHAKNTVEQWGGIINIDSVLGSGTTVTISLPKINIPNWFVPRIELPYKGSIVVVDDELSIHQIWRNRITSLHPDLHLHHFSSLESLSEELDKFQKTVFLVDHHFTDKEKQGLQFIIKNKLQRESILVTSHYEDADVIAVCVREQIKLLPKELATSVPITVKGEPRISLDCVIIHGNPQVRMNWWITSKYQNKTIQVFPSLEQFRASHEPIPHSTPIYIDSDHQTGCDLSGSEMLRSQLGFTEVYEIKGDSPTPPWGPTSLP